MPSHDAQSSAEKNHNSAKDPKKWRKKMLAPARPNNKKTNCGNFTGNWMVKHRIERTLSSCLKTSNYQLIKSINGFGTLIRKLKRIMIWRFRSVRSWQLSLCSLDSRIRRSFWALMVMGMLSRPSRLRLHWKFLNKRMSRKMNLKNWLKN